MLANIDDAGVGH